MEKKYPIGGFAPGNYQGKCCKCGYYFLGDKRAVECESCAVAAKEKFDALSPDEQAEIIKRNVEAVNEAFKDWGKKPNVNLAIIGHGDPKLPSFEYFNLFDYMRHEHGTILTQSNMNDLIHMVHKFHPAGAVLPADDAVQNWFEENIDKECSASSAVYKFRLWLKSLQVTRQTGAVWVKASDCDMSKGGMLFYRFDGPTLKSIGIGHFVGDVFYGTHLDVFPKLDWEYLYVLDESGSPAAEREELSDEIKEVIAAFVKVARHIRNYPHPKLTIELLRSEAVIAETQGEKILGSYLYNQINELAFKQHHP